MDAAALEEELRVLAGAGDIQRLRQLLNHWNQDRERAALATGALAYWNGKLAVMTGNHRAAIEALVQAVRHDPDRAHAWYLLGASLVRCRQWLDAKQALERALTLQPQLMPARMDLARVHYALGQVPQGFALIHPCVDQLSTRAQVSLWVQLLTASDASPEELTNWLISFPTELLCLSDTVLSQWILLAAGLQLSDDLVQARAWWILLLSRLNDHAEMASPLPSRLVLVALLLLELQAPSASSQHLSHWLAQLRGALWRPLSQREVEAWRRWLKDLLLQSAGRLEKLERAMDDREAVILRAVLDALPALEPSGENNFDLYQRLDLLRQGLVTDPARGVCTPIEVQQQLSFSLLRHQRDMAYLIELLDQLQQLNDRKLLMLRASIEGHLSHLSDLAVNRPLLLTSHPSHRYLAQALRMRTAAVECLQRCHQRLSALMPFRSPHQRFRRRWLLMATNDLPQCFLYRVEQKQQQLEALGCETEVVMRDDLNDWAWSQKLLWADAVVVCRLPALHSVLRAIEAVRRAGLPIFYDIDDLIIDPQFCPPALETYGGTLSPEQHRRFVLDVPLFAAAMKACDSVIVSTPSLARRWRSLNPGQPVYVLANLAPPELRDALVPPRTPPRVGTITLVVASGTTAHKQVWIEELAPALEQLLSSHSQLQLQLLGHLQIPMVLQHHQDRIQCYPFTDYSTYLKSMVAADIGLVALESGTFTDAKSAIRWMEFSYLGLASVLSPSRTYTESLKEGLHARFARGQEQWVDQVEKLLTDPGERLAMARRAQCHAQELFGPHKAKDFWSSHLQPGGTGLFRSLGSAHTAFQPRRRRLLVLNVFFAPQSVGGATRVAQDQVRALVDQLGDRWDVTVLCTDKEPWQTIQFSDQNRLDLGSDHGSTSEPKPIWEEQWPWPVDIHDWHGARVVRLAIPPRAWHLHQDASVEAFCRHWFPSEGFDLIHAHCLQVLSVGPLKVAAELSIPYVVTLHDGWWLSPRQFLTSSSGRAVDPADPLGHYNAPEKVEPKQLKRDRQRRKELEEVLAGASARWAVSESFAELHRQAGIADVTVMENRWQPMPSVNLRERRPADQPLRCCFVGGMSMHKGMAVLHSAIMQARPVEPGLQLTVIDSTLNAEDQYQLCWGETSVRFLPAIPMDAMADFYAEQDVLLAPSIWPESYGLVSREALSAGLWVVASDIGALADPIRHGENGHRLPPRDSEALAIILEQLAADHPTPQLLIAFGHGHAPLHRELQNLYEEVLENE